VKESQAEKDLYKIFKESNLREMLKDTLFVMCPVHKVGLWVGIHKTSNTNS